MRPRWCSVLVTISWAPLSSLDNPRPDELSDACHQYFTFVRQWHVKDEWCVYKISDGKCCVYKTFDVSQNYLCVQWNTSAQLSNKDGVLMNICFASSNSDNKLVNITLCNKIWVMSCPWGFDYRTLFVGYQNHRNGLFSALKIRSGSGEFFFLKSELFRCEKVQKGLIQPGRHLRNVFGLQLF